MNTSRPLDADPVDVDDVIQDQQADNAYGLIDALRRRRDQLGLRQKDVAARMGRDPSVVSNIERLGSDPRWSSVRRYASALGVVIEYDLVTREGLQLTAKYPTKDDAPAIDTVWAARQILAAR